MNDKEQQARKRLAKKLTALRKTLRKDERDILDQLVAGNSAEVSGHSMAYAANSASFFLANGAYAAADAAATESASA